MTKPRARICVGAVLIRAIDHGRNESPLVLLGRRTADREFYPNVWDVPGGHLEPGETSEQALVRELREEIGVTPTAWASLGEFRGHLPNGDGSIVLRLYAVTSWNGTPRNLASGEHFEVTWFTVEDACRLALTHPSYPDLLRRAASIAPGSVEGPRE